MRAIGYIIKEAMFPWKSLGHGESLESMWTCGVYLAWNSTNHLFLYRLWWLNVWLERSTCLNISFEALTHFVSCIKLSFVPGFLHYKINIGIKNFNYHRYNLSFMYGFHFMNDNLGNDGWPSFMNIKLNYMKYLTFIINHSICLMTYVGVDYKMSFVKLSS
jgi:hypothetical protein